MFDRRSFLACAAALPFIAKWTEAAAGAAPVYAVDGLAIRGADSVAYFRGDGAVPGSMTERVRWRGADWLFSDRKNRLAFEHNPRRFAPRFGGYCAYTLSQGSLAPTDPRAFTIHEGRLYLVRSLEDREAWRANLQRNIKMAERHWPAVLG